MDSLKKEGSDIEFPSNKKALGEGMKQATKLTAGKL